MTRYTICFDEERDAGILRWMDAQINKSMSLKALVERSIAQEGYNDIFQVAWKRNIQNSTQMLSEPEPAAAEHDTRQARRKRGRPRKNTSSLPVSSASSSVIPETEAIKQNENHGQPSPVSLMQHDNPEITSTSEISTGQNDQYVSDKPPVTMEENQSIKTDTENTEIENDGYRRPGNVNIDMAKFF